VKRLGVVGIALLILHPSPIVNSQKKVKKKEKKKKKKKKSDLNIILIDQSCV